MEIPRYFFSSIYVFLANRFTSLDYRKDETLARILQVLKILYLFAVNKQQTPNNCLVLSTRSSRVQAFFQPPTAPDLTESFSINFWFKREPGEEMAIGRETIFTLTNNKEVGYSLRYDRSSKFLEYVVCEEDDHLHVQPLCEVNSHFWNFVSMFQSYSRCRSGLT